MYALLDVLFPPRVDEKLLRAWTPESFVLLREPFPAHGTWPHTETLLPFSHEAVKAAVHEAKYHGSKHAFTLLAAVLRAHLEHFDAVCLIPVPLSATRQRQRGYNQVERVARLATKELAIEIDTTLLVRTRDTQAQTTLRGSERRENLRNAFALTRAPSPATRYLLLDDVVTTGATLEAARAAFAAHPETDVRTLALAH